MDKKYFKIIMCVVCASSFGIFFGFYGILGCIIGFYIEDIYKYIKQIF